MQLVVLAHALEHLRGLGPLGVELAVLAVELHQRGDLGQPLAGLAEAVAVGQELGIRELLGELLVLFFERGKLFEHRLELPLG